MVKVLVADTIAPEGVEVLRTEAEVDIKKGLSPKELVATVGEYEALVVRSETKVTSEVIAAGARLQVIARAGIGVDNIDLEAATGAGIAVVNAPVGNTVAAAEHTMALMLALARNIPQAQHSLEQGKWERSSFLGVQVRDRVLGIVGLGRVGSEVARRAQAFGMTVVVYDPFVAPDYAGALGVELLSLEALLARADIVTLHTPLTDSTQHLIGRAEFNKMKAGARLINVARGELVDEDALLKALDDGRLDGAALDVFASEPPGHSPLIGHPKVVATPHLGASTEEAQRDVAIEVAEQVLVVLRGQPARNVLNAPTLSPEVHAVVAPYIPVAVTMGGLLIHLAEGQIVGLDIDYQGEIAERDCSVLKAAVLQGLLAPTTSDRVNVINAPGLAQQRGLKLGERKSGPSPEYGSLLTATLETTEGRMTLGGTSMRNEVHIVRVNDEWLDLVPSTPYLLFVEQQDRPGSIGAVGTVTGNHDINISFMVVGRQSPRGRAMMIIGLDDPVPPPVLEEIRSLSQIERARMVRMQGIGSSPG